MASQAPRNLKTTVGENIAHARRAQGLTQREVAQALETDVMQLSKWERGKHRPSDETLFAIAELLGQDFAWFFVERGPAEAAA